MWRRNLTVSSAKGHLMVSLMGVCECGERYYANRGDANLAGFSWMSQSVAFGLTLFS
jgi:hypothetical protein